MPTSSQQPFGYSNSILSVGILLAGFILQPIEVTGQQKSFTQVPELQTAKAYETESKSETEEVQPQESESKLKNCLRAVRSRNGFGLGKENRTIVFSLNASSQEKQIGWTTCDMRQRNANLLNGKQNWNQYRMECPLNENGS